MIRARRSQRARPATAVRRTCPWSGVALLIRQFSEPDVATFWRVEHRRAPSTRGIDLQVRSRTHPSRPRPHRRTPTRADPQPHHGLPAHPTVYAAVSRLGMAQRRRADSCFDGPGANHDPGVLERGGGARFPNLATGERAPLPHPQRENAPGRHRERGSVRAGRSLEASRRFLTGRPTGLIKMTSSR